MWGVHVPICVGVDGRCILIFLFIFLLLLLLLFKVLISLVVWAGPPAAGQRVAGLVRWHQAVLLQGGVGVLHWLLVLTPHPPGGLLGLVLDDIRTVRGVQKGEKKQRKKKPVSVTTSSLLHLFFLLYHCKAKWLCV